MPETNLGIDPLQMPILLIHLLASRAREAVESPSSRSKSTEIAVNLQVKSASSSGVGEWWNRRSTYLVLELIIFAVGLKLKLGSFG